MRNTEKRFITIENIAQALRFLLVFLILFSLQSCGKKSRSSIFYSPSIDPVIESPLAPSELILKNPATSPSNDSTPEIQISGISTFDNVELYSDSTCTVLAGSGVSAGTTINITTSILVDGTHLFYAKTTNLTGYYSNCSEAFVSYTLNTALPDAPNGLTLNNPATSPNNDDTPEIQISGVINSYDVELHTNSVCTELVASGVAAGATINITSSALVDGNYIFHAKTIDGIGNESSCSVANVGYILDTNPPTAPNGLALNDPATSPNNDDTPEIQISGVVNGDTVELHTDNSCTALVGSGTAASATINITTSSALGDATYTFYAKSIDPAGNNSTCSTANVGYVLDTNPPAAPTGLALNNPATSPNNDDTPEIQISGVVNGDTVELHTDNSCTALVGSGTAAGATINVTTSSALGDATYTFYAKSIDPAGNGSTCSVASIGYVLDTNPPAAPSGLVLNDPATSPNNDTTPEIQISGVVNGDDVELHTNNSCTALVGSGTAAGATINITSSALGDGSYTFYAKAIDPVGNNSTCSVANIGYVLDTNPPAAPSGLALNDPATSPNNDTTPEIQISGVVDGDNVELHASITCSALVGSGTATGTTINVTSSALGDGNYTFYAKSIDPAGNESTCSVANVGYVLDTNPPAEPTGLALNDPATSPANDTTPEIQISGVVNGDDVELHTNNSCTALVGSETASGAIVNITTSSALGDATYTFYAKSIDPAGNESTCSVANVGYVLDTNPPAEPTGLALNDPATSPANDTTPEIQISGVVNGDDVELHTNNSCTALVGSETASGAIVNITTSSALGDATYTFYAKSIDPAGNGSTCSVANVGYVLDTNPPAAPTGLALNDPATSPNNDDTPEIQISGVVNGDTVELHTDNSCTALVGSGTAAGATINVTTSSALGDATYTFYAKSIDPAGNGSTCSVANIGYILDTNPPAAPSGLALNDPATSPNNDDTPEIQISGVVNGDTVELHTDNSCTALVGSGTAAGATINITTSSALGDATYTFYAKAIDPVGNGSTCSVASVGYVLDTTPPSAPTGLALNDPATSPNNDDTPEIQISGVVNGDDVELHTNSSCTASVGGGTATGATINITSSALGDATYTFYAKAIDPVGNNSTCSVANVGYILDTTPPDAPDSITLIEPAVDSNLDSTPTIRVGGVTSDDTVKLFSDNICTVEIGTGVAPGITIDITTISLATAAYTIYANRKTGSITSACSTATLNYEVVGCPTGYIPVPKNNNLETNNFCVMKYEAKAWLTVPGEIDADGCGEVACTTENWGIATHEPRSVEEGHPWRRINQVNSKTECTNLGAGYDLISNQEWITIARNAENVSSNWTGGSVGNGCMFRGNSDETDCGYDGPDPDSGAARNARAKLTLSNAEEIYDFSGNVIEAVDWTLGGALALSPQDCAAGWLELNDVSMPCGSLVDNDYNTFNGNYDSVEGVGKLYGGNGGGAFRGGAWFSAANGGAFMVELFKSPTATTDSIGFRCVWRPYVPPIPNSISLINPSGTPDLEDSPTIEVGGVTSGDTVKLFTDDTCVTQIGSGDATGTTVDIVTDPLSEGSYTIYANTTSDNYVSDCSAVNLSYEVVVCPTGYIPVPANANLGTDNFCVMKYEAKAWLTVPGEIDADGCEEPACTTPNWGIATHEPRSVEDGQPWRRIDQNNAKTECTNLGTGYDLISNPEWMTIARNVEQVDSNWTGGTVGIGCMFRGNSGDTTCGYDSATDPDSGSGRDTRAKFTLSNAEEVYDFAGNLWEWVDWTLGGALTLGPTDCATGWVQLPDVSCSLVDNDYNTFNGTYDSSDGVGQFYGGDKGGTARSSYWANTDVTGAFSLFLTFQSTNTSHFTGFRCVWRAR